MDTVVEAFGLLSLDKHVNVPLKSIDTDVLVAGLTAQVRATLTYHNGGDAAYDVVYVFPVDDSSAVYRLEADIDGRRVVAECQERNQARETYEEAVREGHTAVLLEEEENAGDTLKCYLGNMPAHCDVIIHLVYITELSVETDDSVKFTLPRVLRPRYHPCVQDGGKLAEDIGSDQTPRDISLWLDHETVSPYLFDFKATIISEDKIVRVTSPYWQIRTHLKIEDKNNVMQVSLVGPPAIDHDVTFHTFYEHVHRPVSFLGKGNKEDVGNRFFQKDVLMLNFYPDFTNDMDAEAGDFIFVVDRSGSMGDDNNIASARQALLYFIKSLPLGCYFNIVGFGSNYECLFKRGSVEYTEASVSKALRYQESMEADMGGTEILRPLKWVYSQPTTVGHPRQVFLLTDGEVSNTHAVVDLVKKNAGKTRVFAVGIGEGASTSLVRGVARAGKGVAEFVSDTDRLQQKVIQLLKKAMQPSVSDLHLDLDLPPGLKPTLTIPTTMPVVFGGERCIMFVFIQGQTTEKETGKATLSGHDGSHAFSHQVDIEMNSSNVENTDFFVHRLALKAHIKQLEIEGSHRKREVIGASLAGNLVSAYTSFVGVDRERKHVIDTPHHTSDGKTLSGKGACKGARGSGTLRQMSGGRGGRGGARRSLVGSRSRSRSRSRDRCKERRRTRDRYGCKSRRKSRNPDRDRDRSRTGSRKRSRTSGSKSKHRRRSLSSSSSSSSSNSSSRSRSRSRSRSHRPQNKTSEIQPLDTIVRLQTFNGSWRLTQELATSLGMTEERLTASVPDKLSSEGWVTAIVLCWLEVKHGQLRDEWGIIHSKALKWLTGLTPNSTELLTQARHLVNSL